MATSLVPESAVRACSAAPVPRPPQPTRPILMVLLPAGVDHGHRQDGCGTAASAAVEPVRKSRRLGEAEELSEEAVGLAGPVN